MTPTESAVGRRHRVAQAESDVLEHDWKEPSGFLPRAVVQPLQRIVNSSSSSALMMLAGAVLAIVWVNGPFGDSYESFWTTEVQLAVGPFDALSGLTVRESVSEGLMTVFFFVVALEIKRELVSGELRAPRAAALPVLAALGGMIVPAIIYTLVSGGQAASGWGIPMATDIAFAVAVVSAVGRRVPTGARLFLLSVAIVDDVGAIIVIALFYTAGLQFSWLIGAAACALVAYVLARQRVRSLTPYIVLAVCCWVCLHESGVHPTIAGVAFGFLTPAWSYFDPRQFGPRARRLADTADAAWEDAVLTEREYAVHSTMAEMRRLTVESRAPLDRLEAALTPWATLLVVPLFALASSGLVIESDVLTSWATNTVSLGIALGLLVGKPIGVLGATWLAVRCRLARLPSATSWWQMLGVSTAAGVGFTVALFVSGLAFDDPSLTEAARHGVFAGSLVAGALAYVILRIAPGLAGLRRGRSRAHAGASRRRRLSLRGAVRGR